MARQKTAAVKGSIQKTRKMLKECLVDLSHQEEALSAAETSSSSESSSSEDEDSDVPDVRPRAASRPDVRPRVASRAPVASRKFDVPNARSAISFTRASTRSSPLPVQVLFD